MTVTTIFSVYEPIERYIRLVGAPYAPAKSLPALDAYLMSQIAAWHPIPPTVIDWSSDHTLGASAVLWLTAQSAGQVYLVRGNSEWQRWIEAHFELFPTTTVPHAYLEFIEAPEQAIEQIGSTRNRLAPIFWSIAVTDQDDQTQTLNNLHSILCMEPMPIVFIWPLGKLGSSSLLAQILNLIEEMPYEFVALREVSPFFAASEVGILYPAGSTELPSVLKRLSELYEGNYDYLSLLKATFATKISANSERAAQLEREILESREQAVMITLLRPGLVQSLYHRMVPVKRRLGLRRSREMAIANLQKIYQSLIPTPLRLAFRDVRVALIKR